MRSCETPDHVFVKWVDQSCTVTNTLTHGELWNQAGLVVELLKDNGIKPGDRVMIAYPFGLEFLSGLIGCMRLGAIACSVYPPNFLDKYGAKHSFAQFNRQVEDAGATIALTTGRFKGALFAASVLGPKTKGVKWLATDSVKFNNRTVRTPPTQSYEIEPEDIAFIQYSSGSTGQPKGATIRHDAIVHHLNCVDDEIQYETGSAVIMWMPQYHDFALIAGFMLSSFSTKRGTLVICSPLDFIRNPLLWVDMIEKFNGTHTGGPNFSYSLLAKRMKAAGRKIQVQTLVQAAVAAEPIAPDTLVQMQEIGINKSVIATSYGMAEACVRVTYTLGDEIRVVDGKVSSGYLPRDQLHGTTVKVASAETGQILPNGEVGEIYLRGPSISRGYWNKPELDCRFNVKLSDGDEYFETGDLGRIVDDHLYVVGRSKELIIINGRNVYPTDIEVLVESEYPDIVRPGSSVAFQRDDTDICLIIEIRKSVGTSRDELPESFSSSDIKRLVSSCCDVDIGLLLMMKQGTIPKTTSGKLKRVEARRLCMEDEWDVSGIIIRQNFAAERGSNSATRPDRGEGGAIHSGECDINGDDVARIISAVLGEDVDMSYSWTEIGLSSLAHAELSTNVEERFRVKLPVNFHETFQTPNELKDLVVERSGRVFQVTLPDIAVDTSPSLPKFLILLSQAFGIVVLLLLLMLSWLASFAFSHVFPILSIFEVVKTSRYELLFLAPLMFPIFVLVLSVCVVVVKWLVVGRYKPVQITVYSIAYLRWWFVDRMVGLWEMWVGSMLLETPLIWLFYSLLGCSIHPKTEINAFIREFDLIAIGPHTIVNHQIRCRRFGPWTSTGPTLRFRPVVVGPRSVIDGMVVLGCKVGSDCCVDNLAVLPEGAQLEPQTFAVGNPAFDDRSRRLTNESLGYILPLAKSFWLLVELYVFFGLLSFSRDLAYGAKLLGVWRYGELVHWLLAFFLTSFLSVHVGAMLSRFCSFLNRSQRKRGSTSDFSKFTSWICDYHYQASIKWLNIGWSHSKLWNIILQLHGFDIDMESHVLDISNCLPSKAHQIVMKRSFVSAGVEFRPGESIEVIDSTVGYGSVLSSGIKVFRSTIRVYADVQDSLYDDFFRPFKQSVGQTIVGEVVILVFVVLFGATFIPACEIVLSLQATEAMTLKVVGMFGTIVTQLLVWTVFAKLFQSVALLLIRFKSTVGTTLADMWYRQLIHVMWFVNIWGHWSLLWGTPFSNGLSSFMGATIEGDLLFNGKLPHDFHALTFKDKTIVDDCQVTGHVRLGSELIVGPSVHSGVLHEGCFTIAGTKMDGPYTTECGPWRAIPAGSIESSVPTGVV